ncbi:MULTISPECIES: UDP-N-acetylglucosamine--undecaprenyl-phosphate N-acetylglucosaminephosphotransferase [Vibrio]|uniref:Undecaprenyl-phosphate alpha-N-acetylglucosaminyl 1-phosphate transferase n=1 Tax=Vibrio cyclitrophicus ZF270 TaxID=1136176 RepID=A0AAN0LMJ6_9VIBR|nr:MULTISPECIES: UDP-N-acetylglucosamine--undecaprenyl-phosphate N-acetylglucosaminephosphotransferase [Vibrio]MBE8557258.1 UDP-N-acetylglucosamine--undecaprenyl-phosphate N-acetylglucosaminephosphotransferase [Vibrio sp. OPT24]OEE04275.1 undecaprenyl-phosphate alpha-N-acetylglucosaminyl 1-phosphate transferase [Vibrio cyclitrophicus ZF270]PMH57586.1 undecaprenyl-phosphate alpha-N-acetylglucosaminyl 1-phosphate transferase [Vibrio cyclitrophicus]PMJ95912.1 undecaprenyl-phosphate alpha-N-acetylg
MLLELSFVGFFSFSSLFLMRKVAKAVGLVDKPNERKLHNGAIPLVGGIAISLSISQYLVTHPDVIPHSQVFLASIAALIVIGALDDKFDISFKIRLIVQAILSICMMYFADLRLENIGNLFGLGDLHLGFLSPVITILAVIGAINAFNMVDGIDGLLGGLAIVTLGAIAILLQVDSQHGLAYLCVVFIVAIIPYILMNLGILGRERKVFMGDAGSMMIGFTVIWLLLGASQDPSESLMRPITALWLIAVPLMDMAAIMFRRVRRGVSPFKPDREHLHHIFQRLGCTPRQTLAIICAIASSFAGFGIYGEFLKVPESTMFILFLVCFAAYTVAMSYVWRITSWVRRCRNLPEKVY